MLFVLAIDPFASTNNIYVHIYSICNISHIDITKAYFLSPYIGLRTKIFVIIVKIIMIIDIYICIQNKLLIILSFKNSFNSWFSVIIFSIISMQQTVAK